ncbi:permease prefix domain 1-containing protein [Micromonospora sp. WMMD812]|uniref:permease prefix domain 1-containing protein n=1 Tax=Micromonospora sp. WMMD812 TaxID=3015152 RepID=UPI00248A957C|nr:permease prefix domain 1-containing protein [Micromonospora sp. WMMD812]WBB65050.1 permease prefix domain 1-containing protein [Micromonospora sp. WMMD812]
MPRCDDVLVEDRLRELSVRLRGPARLKSDLLTEARHGLLDAVEAYRASGLPAAEAERRAVAEFGSPAQLLPAWQAELAVGALRGLSVRVLALAAFLTVAGDLTWRGSSWSSDGPHPPAGYHLLSQSVNGIWLGALALSVAGLLLVTLAARSAHPAGAVLARLVGAALTGLLALGVLAGAALFGWSIGLWDAALTWPPMIVGMVVVGAGYAWVGRAARAWLLATLTPGRPVPAGR